MEHGPVDETPFSKTTCRACGDPFPCELGIAETRRTMEAMELEAQVFPELGQRPESSAEVKRRMLRAYESGQ